VNVAVAYVVLVEGAGGESGRRRLFAIKPEFMNDDWIMAETVGRQAFKKEDSRVLVHG
jgi:hypothetical protein